MFRVSGEWVSPIEVESALVEHPAVLETAVVAQPDENGLLKPCAFVTLKQPDSASEALAGELHEFVRQRLAGYIPSLGVTYSFMDTLWAPGSKSGNYARRVCCEWACVIRSRNKYPSLTEHQTKKPAALHWS
jgi:acyl-CoA synthetase (AMP-forming)/AMP-acid ligase II